MDKIIRIIGCALLAINLSGCALIGPSVPADKGAAATVLPPYSGLKAKIAVADFDITAAKATRDIGSGLRQMFVSALTNSSRFLIVDYPAMHANSNGQKEAASEQAPDLIISVIVNKFEPQASGGSAGIGGGGGVGSGVLGGLLGTNLNKAHMAMDIRIIAASNSEVLASTRVQGQASDVKGREFGNWQLANGLSAYAGTPMEKAIRFTMLEAVRYISQTIPASYYKY